MLEKCSIERGTLPTVAYNSPAANSSRTMSAHCPRLYHLLYSCGYNSFTVVVWIPTPTIGVRYTGQTDLDHGGSIGRPLPMSNSSHSAAAVVKGTTMFRVQCRLYKLLGVQKLACRTSYTLAEALHSCTCKVCVIKFKEKGSVNWGQAKLFK